MKYKITVLALVLAGATLLPGSAIAALIVSIQEQGSDVVINYSGSWDTWSVDDTPTTTDLAVYRWGMFHLTAGSKDRVASGLSLDSGLWTTVLTRPDSTSGDNVGWNTAYSYAPLNYTAGDPISGSMTFNGTDLTTMGFTLGDSGTFTGGGNTVNFSVSSAGPAAVPEPGTWAAAALLASGAALMRWRKRAKVS